MEVKIQLGPESPEISNIFGDNFLKLNKELVQIFGLVDAVVLCNFKEKDIYFRHFKGSNGTFFLDKKSQEKELNIGTYVLREVIKRLVDCGVLKVERKGIPPRYWYEVNYNELSKRVDLYRSENRIYKDKENASIINKTKWNKIKPDLKDFGDAASQPSPDSSFGDENLDLEIKNKPSNNSNQNPPKPRKKRQTKTIDPTIQKKAERILQKFNEGLKLFKQKTGQPPTNGWRPLPDNLAPIIARLNDGYLYKEFIHIIETKIHDPWFITRPHLYVPTTLFGADKFTKYANEDPKQFLKQKQNKGPSNGSGYTGTRKYKEPIKISIKHLLTSDEDL